MVVEEKIELVRTLAIDNQRDISSLKVKVDIFDNNLDKLTDISLNVSKLLAVHEQRIDTAEKAYRTLPDIIEKHRQEAQAHATRALDKASKVETDLRAEIGKSQKEILDEIKIVSNGMNNLRLDFTSSNIVLKDDLELQITNKEVHLTKKIEALDERIGAIQKLVWIVTGGAAVVGAVASQLSGLLHITLGS
jgi:hypothetical protein